MNEQTKPEVKIDDQGRAYVWVTKTVHGQETKVKIYGEQGKRPKQFCR